jgi:hypothetical protein
MGLVVTSHLDLKREFVDHDECPMRGDPDGPPASPTLVRAV